jgi:hypothetical protein
VFGSIADVAGFWPIQVNPLSGASYRDRVVQDMGNYVDYSAHKKIVLVGHSQGSVLSLWLVRDIYLLNGGAKAEKLAKEISLVTCGSPLHSLYEMFFPVVFNPGLFKSVELATNRRWVNVWRPTDPIATEVSGANNVELGDPEEPGGPLRKHSDYWLSPTMDRIVDHLVEEGPLETSQVVADAELVIAAREPGVR